MATTITDANNKYGEAITELADTMKSVILDSIDIEIYEAEREIVKIVFGADEREIGLDVISVLAKSH